MRASEYILFERKQASNFNEAYPIGNGHLGGMVYGDLPKMCLGLNHDELWSGGASSMYNAWNKEDYFEARRVALSGDYSLATKILKEKYSKYDAACYLTLGDLFLEFEDGEITDYRRELNIRDSLASVSFKLDGSPVSVKLFASFPDNLIAVRVESARKLSFKLSLDIPLGSEYYADSDTVFVKGTCPVGNYRYEKRNSAPPDLEGKQCVSFITAFTVLTDGEKDINSTGFDVRNAKTLTAFFTADTSYKDGFSCGDLDYAHRVSENIRKATALEYNMLLTNHVNDVNKLFSKVTLTLGEPSGEDTPTSERIDNFERVDGTLDCDLITLAFNYGRYLMIAGSREGSTPLNLQGIWNDKMDPPWSSNYTTNINLQIACGLEELTELLERLIFILSRTGKESARALYGASGFAAGHNADIFGYSTPVWGEPLWSFFPFSAAWLLRQLYEKYEYTLDKTYLEKIFPLLGGAASFILDTLVDDGKYLIFSPGTSPENSYLLNGEVCQVARSTAMYGAIIRETLKNLVKADEILGKNTDIAKKASSVIPRLLPVRVTPDGRIEEWYFGENEPDIKEKDPHHRHISHLYDLYPAREINEDTPELMIAASKSLDVRGDDSTGWSLGWKMNCRARLHDSNGFMRLLRLFFRRVDSTVVKIGLSSGGGVYGNLFCAHPPFQIDGNFAFTTAISEMLVGEHNGNLRPLCALPKEIPSGSVKGLRIRGGKTVDMTFKNGKVEELIVRDI